MAYNYGPIVGILGALLIFGLAVFVHELGHFIMAKLTGVGVKEFAIGMGPKLVSIHFRGTDYSIRGIPFGGFVMLSGAVPKEWEEEAEGRTGTAAEPHVAIEEPPKDEQKDLGDSVMEDMEALRGKPTWVKVLIFASGVAMNFVAAMVAVGIAFAVGYRQPQPMPPQVGLVEESSEYYAMGLRTLDTIVSINDQPVANWEESLEEVLAQQAESQRGQWAIEVRRGEDLVNLETPPVPDLSVDLAPAFPAYIAGVHPKSPAARVEPANAALVEQDGLVSGDHILAIDGQEVAYFFEMQQLIEPKANEPVELKVKRQGINDPIFFYPVVQPSPTDAQQGMLGVFAGNDEFEVIKEPVLTAFANAPARTFDRAVFISVMTGLTLYKLATEFNTVKGEVAGPVGIMTMAYQASRSGLQQFINLFVILNLALMVFNLLPIPVLDGGHIAVSVIEGVSRRQIPPKILAQTYTVVAILLICLMLLLTYQDIMTWFFKM